MTDKANNSSRPYFKYFLIYGLVSLGISLVNGAYNNFFPILLQSGNPNFAGGVGDGMGYGLSAFATSIIMSIDNAFSLVLAIFVGAIGDKMLRRREFSTGINLAAVAAFVFLPLVILTNKSAQSGDTVALMPQLVITIILVLIFVCGSNGGAQMRVGYSYNVIPKENHSVMQSYAMVFGGIGFLVFTALGSVLYGINRALPFIVGGVLTFIILLLFLLVAPKETKKAETLKEEKASNGKLDYNPLKLIIETFKIINKEARFSIILILISAALANMGVWALETFASSYMLDVLGLPPNVSIIVIAAYYVGYLASAMPAGAIAKRINKAGLMLAGVIIMAVGALLALTLGKTAVTLAIFCVIIGMGQGTVLVVSDPYVMSFAPEDGAHTGTLYSTITTVKLLVSVISVPIVGALIDLSGSYSSMFVTMIIACILGTIPMFILIRKQKNA